MDGFGGVLLRGYLFEGTEQVRSSTSFKFTHRGAI